jgi:CubicO group peptidase (beta-lactamase class C family)
VDSIAWNGVMQGAYPGCRVLVAKDGWVVYDKAFGSLDWNNSQAVDQNTVYDLASITKVASGTLAAMKLVDEKKLDVNKTLGDYLDIPQDNVYSKVVIKEMLAHTAGFTAWIPFYTKTMSDGVLDPSIYKTAPERGFSNQVADGIYIKDDYKSEMMKQVLETPISADKTYKYSDLAFYFTQELVEKISNQPLDQYVTNHFYKPMGLHTIGYKPLERMDKKVIAPTENDKVFRAQHVTGYVHDQGAAMLGGVAGHAGLFSNAQDLAAIMQMLMNKGVYGDKTYISNETIRLFNTRHFAGNRRGLGFDKPAFSKGTGSSCAQASSDSFGHTGFTGTMCWADPETGIVYIFLSNRVNPDAENKKLLQLDIRTRIQSEVYRVLGYAK